MLSVHIHLKATNTNLSLFQTQPEMLLVSKAMTQRQSKRVDEPVEKEVHWYGAEVPHSMSI